MPTFSYVSTSTRRGHSTKRKEWVVEGVDVVVQSFTTKAATIRPKAEAIAVKYAREAADAMLRNTNAARVKQAITADAHATRTVTGFYADAGPDKRVSNQAFIAHFLEYGTVKHGPKPFARPAADEVQPKFLDALKKIL